MEILAAQPIQRWTENNESVQVSIKNRTELGINQVRCCSCGFSQSHVEKKHGQKTEKGEMNLGAVKEASFQSYYS